MIDVDLALRLLRLTVPAAIGVGSQALQLFRAPQEAIAILNRYALFVAFPALVVHGLLSSQFNLPAESGFYLLWPVALLMGLRLIRRFGGRPGEGSSVGPTALAFSFGNVAYLGMPYVAAIEGPPSAGSAALLASLHSALAVTAGAWCLERWSGRSIAAKELAARVLRQPLFWSPLIGLVARLLPETASRMADELLSPIAATAGPVALFTLGVHLFAERSYLGRLDRSVIALLVVRQLLAPTLVLGLAAGAVALGLLSPEGARLHLILASMPLAVTTFAMATEVKVGADRVASAVVWSSLTSLLLLPAWSAVAASLFD